MLFEEVLTSGVNPYAIFVGHQKKCFLTNNKREFSLAPNIKATNPQEFLKASPIRENKFEEYWHTIFGEIVVRGVGPHSKPMLHSLRKTMANNLLRTEFSAH